MASPTQPQHSALKYLTTGVRPQVQRGQGDPGHRSLAGGVIRKAIGAQGGEGFPLLRRLPGGIITSSPPQPPLKMVKQMPPKGDL